MEYTQAIELLRGPLKFGDEQQLAAIAFLKQVEAARTRLCYCKRCKGFGYGTGRLSHRLCSCLEGESRDVLHALAVEVPKPHLVQTTESLGPKLVPLWKEP